MNMAPDWRSHGACSLSAWSRHSRFIFTITLVYCLPYVTTECPAPCQCQLQSGISIVTCPSPDSSTLHHLPRDTDELNLTDCRLKQITPDDLAHLVTVRRISIAHGRLQAVALDPASLAKLKHLDLTDNQMINFPTGLPSTLKVIQLSKNKISTITAEEFKNVELLRELFLDKNQIRSITRDTFNLINTSEYRETPQRDVLMDLQKLILNSNKIDFISENAFQNQKNLVALNLANNRISSVQRLTFAGLHNLQNLDLSRNKISTVELGTFEKMTHLRYLSLKHNRLTSVPQGLPMLEWLFLSYNHIKEVPVDFKPVFYTNEVIILGQNPFHCDCDLLWLKEFYDQREYLVKHLDIDPYEFIPMCASPQEMLGETWDVLSDDMFTCDDAVAENDGDPHVSFDPSRFKVTVNTISDTFIQVDWLVEGELPEPSIVIQYYEFGHRAESVKHVEISWIQRGHTLKHLKPETNYVICVTPKLKNVDISKLTPLSMDHCVEVTTIRVHSIHPLSFLAILCYYVLASVGTILFLLIFIGAVALIGSIFMKGTDWSSKYVAIDEPIRDEDENQDDKKVSESYKLDSQSKPHSD